MGRPRTTPRLLVVASLCCAAVLSSWGVTEVSAAAVRAAAAASSASATAEPSSSETAAETQVPTTSGFNPEAVPDLFSGEPTEDNQLMFSIAMSGNFAYGKRGSVENLTEVGFDYLNATIPRINAAYGTNMELVWGPAFFMENQPVEGGPPVIKNLALNVLLATNNDAGQPPTFLNALYVARETVDGVNKYYVGIAGTNDASLRDWILEDFATAFFVPWPYAPSTGNASGADVPGILQGLDYGLRGLQTATPITDSPYAQGGGMNFSTFMLSELKANPDTPVEVRVAGHSLGGGLCPLFALWVQDTILEDTPNSTVTANLYAGVTPGNKAFAEYYASRPVAKGTVATNNWLDVIPHAWTQAGFDVMNGLYEPVITDAEECFKPLGNFIKSFAGPGVVEDAARVNPNGDKWFEVGYAPGIGDKTVTSKAPAATADAAAASDTFTVPPVPTESPAPSASSDGATRRRRQGLTAILAGGAVIWGAQWEKCKPVVEQILAEFGWQHVDAYYKFLDFSRVADYPGATNTAAPSG